MSLTLRKIELCNLLEMYLEALEDVLKKSQVIMVPHSQGNSSSSWMPKIDEIAQVMSVYKGIMGDPRASKKLSEALSSSGHS